MAKLEAKRLFGSRRVSTTLLANERSQGFHGNSIFGRVLLSFLIIIIIINKFYIAHISSVLCALQLSLI